MQEQPENRILLHACCGICSAYPIRRLREEGLEPVVYFYNPNIYPFEEYEKRIEAQKNLCKYMDCELIVGGYDPADFYEAVKGFEDEPEGGKRCLKCFELRLLQAAKYAKEVGLRKFTTSIVISPHKNYQNITEIGEKIAKEIGIEYVAIDFKKKDGFLTTNKIANSLNLYRQNYCGCEFSMRKG